MKRIFSLLLLLAVVGCRTQDPLPPPLPLPSPTNTISRAEWFRGVVLSLERVPDARTIEALGRAGASPAKPDSALIWNLPNYDRQNQDQIYAIDLARAFGVVMRPLRP